MVKYNYRFLLLASLVSAMGGLLFGYDWVVIDGAKPFYEQFFHIDNSPNLQGLAICYAMSLATVTCLVLSEIFPNRIRGAAMAIATVSLWLASFLLISTFPLLNNAFGSSGNFWLYGILCLLGFLFIYRKLPETKGKSLEEIEKELTNNQKNNHEKLSIHFNYDVIIHAVVWERLQTSFSRQKNRSYNFC